MFTEIIFNRVKLIGNLALPTRGKGRGTFWVHHIAELCMYSHGLHANEVEIVSCQCGNANLVCITCHLTVPIIALFKTYQNIVTPFPSLSSQYHSTHYTNYILSDTVSGMLCKTTSEADYTILNKRISCEKRVSVLKESQTLVTCYPSPGN